jgi:hypothetical protein
MNNVFSFLNSARILHVAQLAHMATGGYSSWAGRVKGPRRSWIIS